MPAWLDPTQMDEFDELLYASDEFDDQFDGNVLAGRFNDAPYTFAQFAARDADIIFNEAMRLRKHQPHAPTIDVDMPGESEPGPIVFYATTLLLLLYYSYATTTSISTS